MGPLQQGQEVGPWEEAADPCPAQRLDPANGASS